MGEPVPTRAIDRRRGAVVDWRRLGECVAFAGVPLVLLLTTVVASLRAGDFAVDFHDVSPEIRGLAHGTNPYVTAHLAEGGHFIWPILTGLILLPVAGLPHHAGDPVLVAAQVVSLVAALRLLDVRDWRIYGVALAWPATISSVQTANLTLPICLLVALGWRSRDSWRGGVWLGLATAVKLLVWPLLLWLAATRRWRALALAACVQAVAIAVMLPFETLGAFVRFERAVARVFEPRSLTLTALLHGWGAPHSVALATTVGAGLALLAVWRRDFGVCVVAGLILSPVVWLHYLDLLLVPLALWRAPLAVWLVPLLLADVPGSGRGTNLQTLGALAVVAATLLAARRLGRPSAPVAA